MPDELSPHAASSGASNQNTRGDRGSCVVIIDSPVRCPREAVRGHGVAVRNGTSFACPIVPGMPGLSLSELELRGGALSPEAVRDAIVVSTALCMSEESSQCEREPPDRSWSGRRVCDLWLLTMGALIPKIVEEEKSHVS